MDLDAAIQLGQKAKDIKEAQSVVDQFKTIWGSEGALMTITVYTPQAQIALPSMSRDEAKAVFEAAMAALSARLDVMSSDVASK